MKSAISRACCLTILKNAGFCIFNFALIKKNYNFVASKSLGKRSGYKRGQWVSQGMIILGPDGAGSCTRTFPKPRGAKRGAYSRNGRSSDQPSVAFRITNLYNPSIPRVRSRTTPNTSVMSDTSSVLKFIPRPYGTSRRIKTRSPYFIGCPVPVGICTRRGISLVPTLSPVRFSLSL